CLGVFAAAEHRVHHRGEAAPLPPEEAGAGRRGEPPLVAQEQSVPLDAGTLPGWQDDSQALAALDDEDLARIPDSPIEMDTAAPRQRRRVVLYLGANLILVLLLAAQVAWTRFDTLLANP